PKPRPRKRGPHPEEHLMDHPLPPDLSARGWRTAQNPARICKSFAFKDFSEAFGFMSRVALLAEAANHHPDWSNSWNRVEIALSTHSEGKVTAKDLALAEKIERLLAP